MPTIVHSPDQQEDIDLATLLQQATHTILYFYPRDNTPGCTTEALDFTRLQKDFAKLNIQIIGVSKDSTESHCKFQTKHNLGISLISDADLVLHKQYGARGEKKMYGIVREGVIRSTFLLDQQGVVLHERKNIRAKGHAEKVLARAQENL